MTTKELEKRLTVLEETVEQMKSQLAKQLPPSKPDYWWEKEAGRFANDPVFDEIVALGKKYRESLRPKAKRPRRDRSG